MDHMAKIAIKLAINRTFMVIVIDRGGSRLLMNCNKITLYRMDSCSMSKSRNNMTTAKIAIVNEERRKNSGRLHSHGHGLTQLTLHELTV